MSYSYAYVMLEERISDMRNIYAKRNEQQRQKKSFPEGKL